MSAYTKYTYIEEREKESSDNIKKVVRNSLICVGLVSGVFWTASVLTDIDSSPEIGSKVAVGKIQKDTGIAEKMADRVVKDTTILAENTTKAVKTVFSPFHKLTELYKPAPKIEHSFSQKEIQEVVAQWTAETYNIPHDRAWKIVKAVDANSKEFKVDPTLVLGLILTESSGNPYAKSGYGAEGLTQVVPRYHLDKIKELDIEVLKTKKARDPYQGTVTNASISQQVKLGTYVLRDNLASTNNNVEKALQAFNLGLSAAKQDPNNLKYATKVIKVRYDIHIAITGAMNTRKHDGPQI